MYLKSNTRYSFYMGTAAYTTTNSTRVVTGECAPSSVAIRSRHKPDEGVIVVLVMLGILTRLKFYLLCLEVLRQIENELLRYNEKDVYPFPIEKVKKRLGL